MSKQKKMNEPAEKMKCPLCDGPMRKRQGRFGEFFGCDRFPQCTGSRNLMGEVSDTTSTVKHERDKEKQQRRNKPNGPGMMSRKALLGRLGRRGILAISATFLFRR